MNTIKSSTLVLLYTNKTHHRWLLPKATLPTTNLQWKRKRRRRRTKIRSKNTNTQMTKPQKHPQISLSSPPLMSKAFASAANSLSNPSRSGVQGLWSFFNSSLSHLPTPTQTLNQTPIRQTTPTPTISFHFLQPQLSCPQTSQS